MSQPTKEYGYFPPMTGEEMKKKFGNKNTSLDEIWWISRWVNTTQDKFCKCGDCIYRRRIDPGEGYEIVPIDSDLLSGDEFCRKNGRWEPFTIRLINQARTVKDFITINPHILAIRRKISTTRKEGDETCNMIHTTSKATVSNAESLKVSCPAPEVTNGASPSISWIKFSDRMPTFEDCKNSYLQLGRVGLISNTFDFYKIEKEIKEFSFTHWRVVKTAIPVDSPQSDEKDDVEKAFNSFIELTKDKIQAWGKIPEMSAAFLAGAEWKEKQMKGEGK